MSSYIRKYIVHYDSNDGDTCKVELFVKYNCTCDIQQWVYNDGTPLDFGCITDSGASVIAKCILHIPTNDKFFYWKEVEGAYELPEAVKNYFYSSFGKNK